MRQSFSDKVPLVEQRIRVANKKAKRKHGKRHGTSKRKWSNARIRKNRANHAKAVNAVRMHRRHVAAAAYWAGIVDELRQRL
jgi:hypothetical protein